MKEVFKNLRNIFFDKNKSKKAFVAAVKLEKEATNLNIKSKEYIEYAKKASEAWNKKWVK
tara:strand:+ start:423 stop:602 length:180 start_codon:yes stop_codon:yes gene_type:complete